MSPDCAIELVSLSENATYRVDASDGRQAFVRVHRAGYHTLQEIVSELCWMRALRVEADVSTPVPLTTLQGACIVAVRSEPLPDERFCVAFEPIRGIAPSAETPLEWAARLGAIAGAIHRHAAGWQPPSWFLRFVWDFDTIVGAVPRWGGWEDGPGLGRKQRDLLTKAQSEIRWRLDKFGKSPDRFGLVHADLRTGNLLAHDNDATVIDFDDCGYGWFAWDLATGLTFVEEQCDRGEFVARWLDGYRGVWTVSKEVEAEIPTMLLLRRLQLLAWLGLHPDTDLAREAGGGYAEATCRDALAFLAVPGP
jgi:Ser/Thr protein kinase RdoA (MazF antagonist)